MIKRKARAALNDLDVGPFSDISFLLIIFFILTTQIISMSGVILRKTDRSAAPKKRGRPRKTDTVAKNTSEKPEKTKKTSVKRTSASKKTPKKSKA